MKKTTRDYLTVSMAMLAVLLCGYGLGHLVGEEKGLKNYALHNSTSDLGDHWTACTLSQLEHDLSLTPQQMAFAKERIRPFALALEEDLKELRTARTLKLLQFYDSLKPGLDPGQRIRIERLQESLQESFSL